MFSLCSFVLLKYLPALYLFLEESMDFEVQQSTSFLPLRTAVWFQWPFKAPSCPKYRRVSCMTHPGIAAPKNMHWGVNCKVSTFCHFWPHFWPRLKTCLRFYLYYAKEQSTACASFTDWFGGITKRPAVYASIALWEMPVSSWVKQSALQTLGAVCLALAVRRYGLLV